MKSRRMSRRLGVMALMLTVAGPAGPLAAADAAPQMVTGRSSRRGSRKSRIGGGGARMTSSERSI